MLSAFCLRLAFGMLGTLWLLPARLMHPRFFRTHFLTVLGLTLVAGWMASTGEGDLVGIWLSARTFTFSAALLALVGAVVWMFERPPGGWLVVALCMGACGTALVLDRGPGTAGMLAEPIPPAAEWSLQLAADLSSSALLGFAVTSMLVGHSYLISPGLTIRPLMAQIIGWGIAWLARAAVAAAALWLWTGEHDITNWSQETNLWLPVRWLVGLFAPAICGVMAFRTAQIRSTQSATGILYVVVILVFLGELLGLLLERQTGLPL